MENFNYTQSAFLSLSDIRVDILPLEPTKKKFNEYNRSHKIKIRHVRS